MTVWEAHKDLALALGDSISLPGAGIPNAIIPDGVRFMKEHRENALYRAMLTVLRNGIRQAMAMDKRSASQFLLKVFPNLQITFNTIADPDISVGNYESYHIDFLTDDKPIFVFSVFDLANGVPLPLKDHIQFQGMMNNRIVERPDAFATVFHSVDSLTSGYKIQIYVPMSRYDNMYEVTPLSIQVHYLRYPLHPRDQQITDELEIENMWYQQVISLAQSYCLVDSQEIENVVQLIQNEITDQMPRMGVQNASN